MDIFLMVIAVVAVVLSIAVGGLYLLNRAVDRDSQT